MTGQILALPALVDDINREHDLCVSAVKSGLEHAIRCGELLTEAKAKCPHGIWAKWIEKHCTFSLRTAQGYMQVFQQKPALEAKAQRAAHLSIRGALDVMRQRRKAEGEPTKTLMTEAAKEESALDSAFRKALRISKYAVDTVLLPRNPKEAADNLLKFYNDRSFALGLVSHLAAGIVEDDLIDDPLNDPIEAKAWKLWQMVRGNEFTMKPEDFQQAVDELWSVVCAKKSPVKQLEVVA